MPRVREGFGLGRDAFGRRLTGGETREPVEVPAGLAQGTQAGGRKEPAVGRLGSRLDP